MKVLMNKSTSVLRWGSRLAAVTVSMVLLGCSPEGTGSIKIADPQAVRDKVAGGSAAKPAGTEKQAKALEVEAEAAKKHPKLR